MLNSKGALNGKQQKKRSTNQASEKGLKATYLTEFLRKSTISKLNFLSNLEET